MSSFGGIDFTATEEGWSETATAAVAVRGFPGGDNWAIHLGGQRQVQRTITCLFDSRSDYTSFVLKRGEDGHQLNVDTWDGAPVAAVLSDINARPIYADGRVSAVATFILV